MNIDTIKEICEKYQIKGSPDSKRIKKYHPDIFQHVIEITNESIKTPIPKDIWSFRALFILNGNKHPVCKVCQTNPCLIRSTGREFMEHCSTACRSDDETGKKARGSALSEKFKDTEWKNSVVSTRTNTVKERYGVENVFQLDSVKEKSKETHLEKYGVTHNSHMQGAREARASTCMARYGVDHHMKSPLVVKKSSTAREYTWLKNGWTAGGPFANPDFFNDSQRKLFEKYGVANAGYLVQKISKGETYIADYIRSLGVEVIQSVRDIISPYELDIYIPSKNLAIEFNGCMFHSEFSNSKQDPKTRHEIKAKLAAEAGIRLLQITDIDFYKKQSLYLNMIKILVLGHDRMIHARKCVVREAELSEFKDFMSLNHLQGASLSSTVHLVLERDAEIVAVMQFKPTASNVARHGDNSWELSRFAAKGVNGGFDKLIAFFKKKYSPEKIYSFADLMKSSPNSNIYLSAGFVEEYRLAPDYSYVYQGNLHHKYGFRKESLVRKGGVGTTEHEMALSIGAYRIWDAGKICYSLFMTQKA